MDSLSYLNLTISDFISEFSIRSWSMYIFISSFSFSMALILILNLVLSNAVHEDTNPEGLGDLGDNKSLSFDLDS